MRLAQNTSKRRMGPVGSANWHAMLDAAEGILSEDGYGALTSRSIADRLGVKQRLIYYYFQTMDDLIVELFRRSASRARERLSEICSSEQPLRALWAIATHGNDPRLISEFMALASHIDQLKLEVVAFISEERAMQIEVLSAALERHAGVPLLRPAAMALLASSLALALNREEHLGITAGHAQIADAVEALLDTLEPKSRTPEAPPQAASPIEVAATPVTARLTSSRRKTRRSAGRSGE
jgi:AcrR family transcriptional regulator